MQQLLSSYFAEVQHYGDDSHNCSIFFQPVVPSDGQENAFFTVHASYSLYRAEALHCRSIAGRKAPKYALMQSRIMAWAVKLNLSVETIFELRQSYS